MKILKEDILDVPNFSLKGEIDLKDMPTNDALIKSVDKCFYNVKAYVIDKDQVMLNLEVESKVNYLDAKTLNELILDVDFKEDIPFSFNEEQAEQLDIDFFDEEIDLKQLIFDLIMINISFNYSEQSNDRVLSEEDFYKDENQPFAKIFEEKE